MRQIYRVLPDARLSVESSPRHSSLPTRPFTIVLHNALESSHKTLTIVFPERSIRVFSCYFQNYLLQGTGSSQQFRGPKTIQGLSGPKGGGEGTHAKNKNFITEYTDMLKNFKRENLSLKKINERNNSHSSLEVEKPQKTNFNRPQQGSNLAT